MIFLKYPNYLRRTEIYFHISEWVTYLEVFNKTKASGVIYLNVRSENDRAKKFYERNGMKLIDKTSWSEGKIKGDVYQIIVKKNGSQNLESFFPSFDASKIV